MIMSNFIKSTGVLIFCILALCSCRQEQENKVQEVPKSKYADIIRNPLTANGDTDTSNVAKIIFEEVMFNFDTITEGQIIDHTFNFTNKGKKPLLISEAQSTCGCTIAKYTKGILEPGDKGLVEISFDSNGKTGFQDKPVSIYANTLPQKTVVRLQGFVKPKKSKK